MIVERVAMRARIGYLKSFETTFLIGKAIVFLLSVAISWSIGIAATNTTGINAHNSTFTARDVNTTSYVIHGDVNHYCGSSLVIPSQEYGPIMHHNHKVTHLNNIKDPNVFFVDRKNLKNKRYIDLIREQFFNPDHTVSKKVVLTGIEGMGRKAIALAYAFEYRDQYSIIWYFEGSDNQEKLDREYKKLAESIDGKSREVDHMGSLKELSSGYNNKPWLFIYTGVKPVQFLLESLPGGHLMTTSFIAGEEYSSYIEIPVTAYTESECLSYCDKHLGEYDRKEACAVATDLCFHPLSLKYAVSYIALNKTILRFKDFRLSFKQKFQGPSVDPRETFKRIQKAAYEIFADFSRQELNEGERMFLCYIYCFNFFDIPLYLRDIVANGSHILTKLIKMAYITDHGRIVSMAPSIHAMGRQAGESLRKSTFQSLFEQLNRYWKRRVGLNTHETIFQCLVRKPKIFDQDRHLFEDARITYRHWIDMEPFVSESLDQKYRETGEFLSSIIDYFYTLQFRKCIETPKNEQWISTFTTQLSTQYSWGADLEFMVEAVPLVYPIMPNNPNDLVGILKHLIDSIHRYVEPHEWAIERFKEEAKSITDNILLLSQKMGFFSNQVLKGMFSLLAEVDHKKRKDITEKFYHIIPKSILMKNDESLIKIFKVIAEIANQEDGEKKMDFMFESVKKIIESPQYGALQTEKHFASFIHLLHKIYPTQWDEFCQNDPLVAFIKMNDSAGSFLFFAEEILGIDTQERGKAGCESDTEASISENSLEYDHNKEGILEERIELNNQETVVESLKILQKQAKDISDLQRAMIAILPISPTKRLSITEKVCSLKNITFPVQIEMMNFFNHHDVDLQETNELIGLLKCYFQERGVCISKLFFSLYAITRKDRQTVMRTIETKPVRVAILHSLPSIASKSVEEIKEILDYCDSYWVQTKPEKITSLIKSISSLTKLHREKIPIFLKQINDRQLLSQDNDDIADVISGINRILSSDDETKLNHYIKNGKAFMEKTGWRFSSILLRYEA